MSKKDCEDQLDDFKSDKKRYPTLIRAYQGREESDKYVMIWEIKKVASDVNTQWKAGCSLTESDFEDEIKECEKKDYQLFHIHKHTNRFIRR